MKRFTLTTSILFATTLAAASASGQTADASASASTSGAGMALPGQDAPAGASDHQQVVGHLAVGFLGRRSMSIADPAGVPTPVGAPVIGVRYWINPMLGIDAGLGLALTSGSVSAGGVSTDKIGTTVFMLHAGVPLSLASSQHFSFQIVPEVNLGLASATQELGPPQPDNELSGFHLDVGARAGAELHFGFIDVPQLSLQGGVGLAFAIDNTSASNGLNQDPAEKVEDKTTSFGTTLAGNPWDIFAGNISALYYF
jgi:hypothetical protein